MKLNHKMQTTQSKSIEFYKKMLLSRDTEEQIKAVLSIYKILKFHENDFETFLQLVDWLLVNDICVFLCEASVTLQVHFLRLILKCFQKISSVPCFYTQSYSPQIVTCIVRSTQFLVKENGSESVIHELLCFISDVIESSKEYHIPSIISRESIYNVIQIFEFLSLILDKTSYETQMKTSIAYLLHNVIKITEKETIITFKSLSLAKSVVEKCLYILYQILVASKFKCSIERNLDLVFSLLCKLCLDSINLCDDYTVIPSQNSDIPKQKLEIKNGLRETIYKHLIEITSQMKEYEMFVLKPNFDVFLELLNKFLNQPSLSVDALERFVQHLCIHGFLAFLGQLDPISLKTKKLCLINLAEIISVLSMKIFDIDGQNGLFKRHLFEGFMEIGFNYKTWPQKLNDLCASDSTVHSLIIYVYFNCLYSQSPERIVLPLLPYLMEFILQLPGRNDFPNAILKCLWLIFSISCVSITDHSKINGGLLRLQRTISVMSNMLLFKVKNAYTHSQYILMWAFSSHRVSTVIKNQVIILWLEKESTIPEELSSIPAVWSSLLEILVIGEGKIDLNIVKKLLMECIQSNSSEDDSIRQEIWNTLPIVLRTLSIGRVNNVESVLCLLELCTNCPPDLPDISTIQVTASLLPTLLVASRKYNVDVEHHFILGALSILTNSLKHEDKYVLSQFIKDKIFLQYIYDATLNEDSHLSKKAYEMLSIIMYYKFQFNIMSPNCIKMNSNALITTLRDEKDSKKIFSILALIHQALKIGKLDPNVFVVLVDNHPTGRYVNTFKAIFFRLQMTCCKDLKNESLVSWYGINSLLEFAANHFDVPELIAALTSFPWTHKLIHFYMYQNQPTKCHTKFLKFVYNWLVCQKLMTNTNADSTQETHKPLIEGSLMFITRERIINHFNDNSLQTILPEKKKNIIVAILNLISESFL